MQHRPAHPVRPLRSVHGRRHTRRLPIPTLPLGDRSRPPSRAISPTDVHVVNHHGSIDPESEIFLTTLRSPVMILPAWSPTHPSQDALKRMMTARCTRASRYLRDMAARTDPGEHQRAGRSAQGRSRSHRGARRARRRELSRVRARRPQRSADGAWGVWAVPVEVDRVGAALTTRGRSRRTRTRHGCGDGRHRRSSRPCRSCPSRNRRAARNRACWRGGSTTSRA